MPRVKTLILEKRRAQCRAERGKMRVSPRVGKTKYLISYTNSIIVENFRGPSHRTCSRMNKVRARSRKSAAKEKITGKVRNGAAVAAQESFRLITRLHPLTPWTVAVTRRSGAGLGRIYFGNLPLSGLSYYLNVRTECPAVSAHRSCSEERPRE